MAYILRIFLQEAGVHGFSQRIKSDLFKEKGAENEAFGVGSFEYRFFCASVFLYTAVGGAEKAQPATGTMTAAKATKMRAAGVVTEISATTLKIERKVKDKAETMEFALEKPVAKIKAGDKVKVTYITTKDNQNVAIKVTENVPQKAVKKANVEGKAAVGGAATAGK